MNFQRILLLLLILELAYSFVQYQQQTMDGDVVPIVLPSVHYQTVLEQPFGSLAMTEGVNYAGSNRFFIHFSAYHYFRKVPLFLQNFISPIESIYLASSLFKLLIHSFLLWLLARYVSGHTAIFHYSFLMAAVLMAPLFQTTQFNLYLGLISPAVIYTFCYAYPFALLLLWLLPFYQMAMGQPSIIKKWTLLPSLFWAFLVVFLSFSSPLMPPVALLMCPMLLGYFWYKNYKTATKVPFYPRTLEAILAIPKPILSLFPLFILLSLYSFYLGTFNAENSETMSLLERYQRLGVGVFRQFTRKIGFPLLVLFLIINYILIKKHRTNITLQQTDLSASQILRFFQWLGLFSLLYILLLPLGGYRDYRPHIIRSDTFMPVLLILYFLFGISSLYLLKYFYEIRKKGYFFAILIFLSFLTIADEPNFGENVCEKEALQQLAEANEKVVLLKTACPVLSWEIITVPEFSKDIANMLQYWNIIEEERLFYYKK